MAHAHHHDSERPAARSASARDRAAHRVPWLRAKTCPRAGCFVALVHRAGPASVATMRSAHTVEQVRAAEAELMARLPEGALMQRAAAGLAYAVLDLLGSAYGRRVLLLVGSGDNGGGAPYARGLLAPRGGAGGGGVWSARGP